MNCPTCGLSVDEHPANRCLDAWVAEVVFERQVKYVPPEELPPAAKVDGVPILRKHGVWLLDDCDPEQDGVTVSLWDVPASHVSHCSAEIAAAWVIVSRMSGNSEFTYALLRQYPEYGIFVYDDWPAVVTALLGDKELPLHICRAALKVKL